MTKKIWFITGVSTGLGRAIAEAALSAGDTVVGTLRKAATVEVVDPTLKKAMEDEKAMDEGSPSGDTPSSPGSNPSGGAPQPEDKPAGDAPEKP